MKNKLWIPFILGALLSTIYSFCSDGYSEVRKVRWNPYPTETSPAKKLVLMDETNGVVLIDSISVFDTEIVLDIPDSCHTVCLYAQSDSSNSNCAYAPVLATPSGLIVTNP